MGDSEITLGSTQAQGHTPVQSESTLGRGYIGLSGVIAIMAYLILFAAADFYIVVSIWPPSPLKQSTTQNSEKPAPDTTSTSGASATNSAESAPEAVPPAQGASPPPADESPKKAAASTTKGTASAARGAEKKAATPANASSAPPPGGAQKKTTATTNASSPPPPNTNQRKTSTSEQDRESWPVKLFGSKFDIPLNAALFLIVMLCGSMGSLLHGIRSFYVYTGNRELKWSWTAMYILLPFAGALLATICYVIVRGGLSQTPPGNESAYGYAALGALVGLFSEQAVLMLKQIAEKVLAKPEPGKPGENKTTTIVATPAPPPKISGLSLTTGPAAGGTAVTIKGDNFRQEAKVNFGGTTATVGVITAGSIAVTTPAHTAVAVDVEVINPDGKSDVLHSGFTYQ